MEIIPNVHLADIYIKKYGPGWFLDNSLDLIFRRAEDMTQKEEVPVVYFNFGARDIEIYQENPEAFYQGMVFKITDALSNTRYHDEAKAARSWITIGPGEDVDDFLSIGTNLTRIFDLATGMEPIIHSDNDNCFRERNNAFMIANFSPVASQPYFHTHQYDFNEVGYRLNFEKIPDTDLAMADTAAKITLSLMQNCRIPGIIAVPGWVHDLYESKRKTFRRLPKFCEWDLAEDNAYHKLTVEIDRNFWKTKISLINCSIYTNQNNLLYRL